MKYDKLHFHFSEWIWNITKCTIKSSLDLFLLQRKNSVIGWVFFYYYLDL